MSKTSTAVKQRYINKTYDQWSVRLKHDVYAEIEAARGEMSRAAFLLMLVRKYADDLEKP